MFWFLQTNQFGKSILILGMNLDYMQINNFNTIITSFKKNIYKFFIRFFFISRLHVMINL